MARFLVVDERRCLACKQCMIECALAHGEASSVAEAIAQGVGLHPRVHVESVGQVGLPMQCRQCEDAPCVLVCPTEALGRKDIDSPVLLDSERCIGCRCCIHACPFGVIEMSCDGKAAVKCDLCTERVQAGELPACVSGCPTGALRFCEMSDDIRERRRKAAAALARTGLTDTRTDDGPDQD